MSLIWFEGIDWAADSTGNTALSNHYFCAPDYAGGSDTTGDGSKDAPYETHYKIVTSRTAGDYLVFQYGVYSALGASSSNNYTYKGNVKAYFQGDGVSSISSSSATSFFQNICFTNYGNQVLRADFNYCSLIGCTIAPITSRTIRCFDCKFINSQTGTNVSNSQGSFTFRRCIFKNTPLTTHGGSLTSGQFIYSCYFDINSPVILNNGASGNHFYNNNYLGSLDNVAGYTLSDNISLPPLFNNEEGGDFSLQVNSPHINAGYEGENIGGTSFGQSYQYGSTYLDAIVNGDSNISYNLSNGEIVVTDVSVIVTPPKIINNSLRYLPKHSISGFPNPVINSIPAIDANGLLTYYCAWSGIDKVLGTPRKFVFGMLPMMDENGKTTGEDGFLLNANTEPIQAYDFQRSYVLRENITAT